MSPLMRRTLSLSLSLPGQALSGEKLLIKKQQLFSFSLPLNFLAATAAGLCAKLHAVSVHLSMI